MKTIVLLVTFLLSIYIEVPAQQTRSNRVRLSSRPPCRSDQSLKRTKPSAAPAVVSASDESTAEFFVREATVEVTKDQTVVKLAMAQHASVLIELPANDGPRYIIPGDPEMVTVDEKALERNKRAIIVRPGSLFVTPLSSQRKRAPAATVTAQMRSGLVVTFLFYPVADLAQNVHRCVLSYQRDEVVARRRAAGLPVNLDQKEQGGEKPTGQSGAPVSISVEPSEQSKTADANPSDTTNVVSNIENTAQPVEVKPNVTAISSAPSGSLTSGTASASERSVAVKKALARAAAEPGIFKNWTRPLHGVSLSAVQDRDLNEDARVLLLAVRNTGTQPLKLIPGTPDLTLEMHDGKGKVINVQSIKPLQIEVSDVSSKLAAGRTIYYAITYTPPPMGVQHRLKIVVAQANAADEPASIALMK